MRCELGGVMYAANVLGKWHPYILHHTQYTMHHYYTRTTHQGPAGPARCRWPCPVWTRTIRSFDGRTDRDRGAGRRGEVCFYVHLVPDMSCMYV
ncbi:hypothetical protein EON63_15355 [archaeon]|nr:MAG: hypothetical protein EON63_15355 [archaeon]